MNIIRSEILHLLGLPNPQIMPSILSSVYGTEVTTIEHDPESAYGSGISNHISLPDLYFTRSYLTFLNSQLQNLEPQGDFALSLGLRLKTDCSRCRDSSMVYYKPTLCLPNHCIWAIWPRYFRHAV